jgi:ABC-type sugar transport system ATPase subunit
MTLLAAHGIDKSFGENRVLRSVEFSIDGGEVVGLLGENGAGKSTLMHTLSGALQPDAGEIRIDGGTVRFHSVADGMRAGIRFVHQELSIVGALSVAENIFLGDMPTTRRGFVDFRAMREAAMRALLSIGASDLDTRREAGGLRPGEQQLVEIARAVWHAPRLLIMDEPTSSLTPPEAARLLDCVRKTAAAGAAVIFITHRLSEALQACDRLVILRNGEIVAERDPAQTTREDVIADMTGRPALFSRAERRASAGSSALSATEIGDGALVSGVTLEIRKGEIVGLFGLVGAGRTELLELLNGARPLRSGTLKVGGTLRSFRNPGEALKAGVAMVPEARKTRGILPQHSVRRNATLSSLPQLAVLGVVRAQVERARAEAYYRDLSIAMASDERSIEELSGGNQQKLLFARSLMARPSLLLLDEPTQGVDVGAKVDVYAIIRDAAAEGLSVLMASSEIQELLALCDRVAVLSKGRLAGLVECGSATEQEILTLAFRDH